MVLNRDLEGASVDPEDALNVGSIEPEGPNGILVRKDEKLIVYCVVILLVSLGGLDD